MVPMVTTAAPLIPHMAAKIAHITTVPMANPPLTGPNQRYIMSYRSLATPDLSKIMAMKIKRGTATRVNLFMAPQVCAATM